VLKLFFCAGFFTAFGRRDWDELHSRGLDQSNQASGFHSHLQRILFWPGNTFEYLRSLNWITDNGISPLLLDDILSTVNPKQSLQMLQFGNFYYISVSPKWSKVMFKKTVVVNFDSLFWPFFLCRITGLICCYLKQGILNLLRSKLVFPALSTVFTKT